MPKTKSVISVENVVATGDLRHFPTYKEGPDFTKIWNEEAQRIVKNF